MLQTTNPIFSVARKYRDQYGAEELARLILSAVIDANVISNLVSLVDTNISSSSQQLLEE